MASAASSLDERVDNLVTPRIARFRLDPIPGTLDSEHLRRLHQALFRTNPVDPEIQTAYTPGEYRTSVDHRTGERHHKPRVLSNGAMVLVAYSAMDE